MPTLTQQIEKLQQKIDAKNARKAIIENQLPGLKTTLSQMQQASKPKQQRIAEEKQKIESFEKELNELTHELDSMSKELGTLQQELKLKAEEEVASKAAQVLQEEEQDEQVEASPASDGGQDGKTGLEITSATSDTHEAVVDAQAQKLRAPQAEAALFCHRPEAAATSETLGIADIRCPFEDSWSTSRLDDSLQKTEAPLPPVQRYLLLALIREALHLDLQAQAKSFTQTMTTISSTHTTSNFNETMAPKYCQAIDGLIVDALTKSPANAKVAWLAVAQKLQTPGFQKQFGLQNATHLQRLPDAFYRVFEAFSAEQNAFDVNAQVLQDDDLSQILAHPLKALYCNVLFYLLSMHVHYDASDIASRRKFIDELKSALSIHAQFEEERAHLVSQAVSTRLSALRQVRTNHNSFAHTLVTFVSGTDPNGNFGRILDCYSKEISAPAATLKSFM